MRRLQNGRVCRRAVPKAGIDERLRELAANLRLAYPAMTAADPSLADLLVALDNPVLRDLLLEVRALRAEELERLERILAGYVANDP